MKKFKHIREEFLALHRHRRSQYLHEILLNPTPKEINKAKFKNLGVTITKNGDAIVFNGYNLLHAEVEKYTDSYGGEAATFRGTWNRNTMETLHFSELYTDENDMWKALEYAKKSRWLKKYSLISHFDIEDLADSSWMDLD